MKCCIDCFRDSHIRTTIEMYGTVGDCDFCSQRSTSVLNIDDSSNQIAQMIVSLVEIYSVSESSDAKPLKYALRDDWDIFTAGAESILALTKKLCVEAYGNDAEIFSKNVAIPRLADKDFLHEFCVVRGQTWEEFSNSIRYSNRFHNRMFNAKMFASFLPILEKVYPSGTELYRARISPESSGFAVDKMNAPPIDKRTAGRINPEGVGVLYLASDPKTTLNEARATAFDYVSIGKFQSGRGVKVVNLSGVGRTSPFLYVGELEEFVANRAVFQEIAAEIAKPLRRSDSPLSYLPTQYISEFIKSQNYDGVEFASTLNKSGYNLAMFDEALFLCTSVQTVEISQILYDTKPTIGD